MIEQALVEHLKSQQSLTDHLTSYACEPAIFNQEAPADADELWACGYQYGRIVFAVELQGDPERTMGGMLTVDIQCKDEEHCDPPEYIEPLVRSLIHGWFFSSGTFTVAAQWKNSAYFTEPTDQVMGCTVTFDLLAFPILTTSAPDLVARFNEWTSGSFEGLYVINHDELPAPAWRPTGTESAVYWRLVSEKPAGWIPDTFQTIWRTATMRGHVFSEGPETAAHVAREITHWLHIVKRLRKDGESQIMTNRQNTTDYGADALRTGQITVEATYGVIAYYSPDGIFDHINY